MAQHGLRGGLAVPVRSGGETLGVVVLLCRRHLEPGTSLIDILQPVVAQVADVWERKRAEREADRLKDEFFALVSHELRTPLTSITGYLEILLEGEAGALTDAQRRFLATVDRNARRLLRLVGDLLFVAQMEAGSLLLAQDTVDLPRIVAEAVEAAAPRAAARSIAMSSSITPVGSVPGDADRLGQVLDNLIANALKFTPQGGRVEVP